MADPDTTEDVLAKVIAGGDFLSVMHLLKTEYENGFDEADTVTDEGDVDYFIKNRTGYERAREVVVCRNDFDAVLLSVDNVDVSMVLSLHGYIIGDDEEIEMCPAGHGRSRPCTLRLHRYDKDLLCTLVVNYLVLPGQHPAWVGDHLLKCVLMFANRHDLRLTFNKLKYIIVRKERWWEHLRLPSLLSDVEKRKSLALLAENRLDGTNREIFIGDEKDWFKIDGGTVFRRETADYIQQQLSTWAQQSLSGCHSIAVGYWQMKLLEISELPKHDIGVAVDRTETGEETWVRGGIDSVNFTRCCVFL